MLKEYKF